MWWLALGCIAPPQPGIQIGATGTDPDPVPGGAQIWPAGGVTGAAPILVWASGDARCGRSGAVAEVDGDGVADLALLCAREPGAPASTSTTDGRDALVVWSGAAAIEPFVLPIGPTGSVAAGGALGALPDLDGDGAAELALPAEAGQWALIAAGGALAAGADTRWALAGDAGWTPLVPVAGGDYDGDGVSDLVVAGTSAVEDDRVYVVSGATVPAAPRVDAAPLRGWTSREDAPLALVVPLGDVDGDGAPDLAATWAGEGIVAVLRGGAPDGDLGGAPVVTAVDPGPDVRVAVVGTGDLDGDGRSDLALAARDGAETQVAWIPGADLPVDGALSFASYVLDADPGADDALVACDVDGDGLADLLTAHGWYVGAELAGSETPARRAFPSAEAAAAAGGACAGDLDGDGLQDVVTPTLFPGGPPGAS